YLSESSASEVIVPQLACGCGTPRPKKLRKASVKMAVGTVNVNVTIIGPNIFGIKCFNIIGSVLEHSDLAASTYSCVFNINASPRILLDILIQPVLVIARIIENNPLGKITVHNTTTTKYGRPVKISAIRIIYSSTLPPI